MCFKDDRQLVSAHVTSRSHYTFDETVLKLIENIARAGATLFATVDQAAAARSAGLELRPTTLLLFGKPVGGTELMHGEPLIALHLPLRVLVWEDDQVYISHLRMTKLAQAFELSTSPNALVALEKLIELVTSGVISAA